MPVPNLIIPWSLSDPLPLKKVDQNPWNKDIIWLQTLAPKYQSSNTLILTGFVPDTDLPQFLI